MIELPEGIESEERPLDVRYRSTLRGLLTRIRLLYDAIYERFGAEGLDLIRDVSAGYGRDIAHRVREREGVMDLHDVGRFVVRVFNNLRAEGEITEWSDKRISITVPQCPYPFTRPEICRAHTCMEESLVTGLNSDLKYYIEKSIPAGDEFCVHVIEKKSVHEA